MNDVLSRRALVVAILTLPAWAAWEPLVHAAAVSFKVPMTGGQEVPAVQTNGYAVADLTYDPDTRVVTWTITYNYQVPLPWFNSTVPLSLARPLPGWSR